MPELSQTSTEVYCRQLEGFRTSPLSGLHPRCMGRTRLPDAALELCIELARPVQHSHGCANLNSLHATAALECKAFLIFEEWQAS